MTSDPFTDWYEDEHGTGEVEFESDVDEVVNDISFDDAESF